MRVAAVCTVMLLLIMFIACPTKHTDDYEMVMVNYDSLFSLGDSAIKQHYIEQARHQLMQDSLNKAMVTYKDQLTNREQVEAEIRQRVIFKDTVITRRHIVRQVDTIRVVIRDTIYVPYEVVVQEKKKKKRKWN